MCNFHDPRIINLRRSLGMEGFGIYQALMICLSDDGKPLSADCEAFAYEFRVDADKVRAVIYDFDLFVVEDGMFRHRDLGIPTKRKSMSTKERAKVAAEARWSGNSNRCGDVQLEMFQPDPPCEITPAEVVSEPCEPPPKRVRPKSPTDPAVRPCTDAFVELYKQRYGEVYAWSPTDAKMTKLAISKIRAKMPEQERCDTEKVTNNYRTFVGLVMRINDKFIQDNMSPKLIESKFNELYIRLKNENKSGSRIGNQISSDALSQAISGLYDPG